MGLSGSRVLVTGGAGFVGTNLVKRLRSEGCRVRATVHRRTANEPGVEYVRTDLRGAEDCRRVVDGMDYVFMAAASTSGAAAIASTPLAHVTPNVIMNAQMLEAAHGAGVRRFLFVSSSAGYPETGSRPVREEEMFEGDPYDAYYPAGWMKRYGEVLCRMYALKLKAGMPVTVVRPSNLYGPFDKFEYDTCHMQSALIRRVVERQNPIEVWGSGDDVRDLLYIDDFIEGVIRAVERPDPYYVVNLASGAGVTVKEVLRTILDVEGYAGAEIRFDGSKPSTIPIRLVDTARAVRDLGFKPKVTLKEGLRRTIAWYRSETKGGGR